MRSIKQRKPDKLILRTAALRHCGSKFFCVNNTDCGTAALREQVFYGRYFVGRVFCNLARRPQREDISMNVESFVFYEENNVARFPGL